MSSIGYALNMADAIRRQLDSESKRPENQAVTTDEIIEGNAAMQKVKLALGSSIDTINETLKTVRNAALPKSDDQDFLSKPARSNPMNLARGASTVIRSNIALRSTGINAQGTPIKNVEQAMSADGLKPGTQSLEEMANAIEPIIKNFDDVLTKPYLKNYSATLNTVPVVGLKDNKIMYIETKSDPTKGNGIKDIWSLFSSLPAGAVIKPGDKVFLFPYKGDFCLSIGRAVWLKAHRNNGDPALKTAVDNWPNMYVSEWTKLGDTIFPDGNLNGVSPFATLSADRNEIAFHLVLLAGDGKLLLHVGDQLGPSSKFEELKYSPSQGSPSSPPKCKRIAYWDNNFIGLDDSSQTWNISPNFEQKTYTAADPTKVEPVTEFTATDVGLVGVRSDGRLYQRIVEIQESNGDATVKWTPWIKAEGVTNLGVASPGVMLDLNVLTHSLRSRYIDVQTSVYPVVDKIRAFGITHSFYLKNVLRDAQAWQDADTDEKRALAIKNAKSFVMHAKQWSLIVSRSIGGAKESVNIMTKQLHDVRTDLETQLTLLKDKLVSLQRTLGEQEQSLSKLKAAFWGAVAASLLGLALAIVGVATGQAWLVVGAGALFVAGIVAAVVLAVKISELAGSIAETQAQIRDVNTAIEELTTIVKSFTELDRLYGILNTFWGRMKNDASAIGTLDDVTAAAIGEEILYDLSSIEASTEMTARMTAACQTYLDVLNKQGIKIPTPTSAAATSFVTLKRDGLPQAHDLPEPRTFSLDDQFHQIIEAGQNMLREGDVTDYEKLMNHAVIIDIASQQASISAAVGTGIWFDVPALRSSESIWGGSNAFSKAVELTPMLSSISDAAAAAAIRTVSGSMDGSLDEVRPYVQGMLNQIISLGETIQGWTAKFPQLPKPQQLKEVEALQDKAVKACEGAQHQAALANNKFADFTNQAREYQQDIERGINKTNDDKASTEARANAELSNLSPPWYIIILGPIAIIAWMETEKANIRNNLNNALNSLNSTLNSLRDLQQSGLTFNGNAQTWIEMTQKVSGNLGAVYNILSGIWGALLENPLLYAELMDMEWKKLVKDASDVLSILGSGRRSSSMLALSAGPKLEAMAAAIKTEDPGHALLMAAVKPKSTLGPRIKAQADSARVVFQNIDQLLVLPYGKDIIGYWDNSNTERKTLFDVVTSLRTEYVQMMGMEYESVQSLYSLSILQEYRARNAATGKLPLDVFIQTTLYSVKSALRAAKNTSESFGGSAKQFDFVMSVIDNNIKEIERKISDLDSNIESASNELRNKIIWVIADVIALSFATAALLVAFGVIGPVAAAITLAAQIGAGAAVTAATIKTVLDSLSLSDLIKTISALKSLRSNLQTNVDNLKAVQPLFKEVVGGVNELNETLTDMSDTLERLLGDVSILGALSVSQGDVKEIAAAWGSVREDVLTWLDVVNEQGISPISFSVRPKQ